MSLDLFIFTKKKDLYQILCLKGQCYEKSMAFDHMINVAFHINNDSRMGLTFFPNPSSLYNI